MLREHGCSLPIQLWYRGPEELDTEMASLVAEYAVESVDALSVTELHDDQSLRGWEIKPFSILHASFEEVLFMDADNVAVRDPTYLFDEASYRGKGALFWPDKGRFGEDRLIWKLMEVPYRSEPEFESGQLVVDKSRCWKALMLTQWMNENSDFFYHYMHGDKDTFRMAFHRLKQAYGMIDIPVVEHYTANHRGFRTRRQHDSHGQVLFQHRSYPKWSLYGPNPRVIGFLHEERCLELIAELREVWTGEIDGPSAGPMP